MGVSETVDSFLEAGLGGAEGAGSLPQTPPDQLVWCGSDGLALFWEVRLAFVATI